MNAPALAEAAIDLPWLSPCAASLVALVRSPAPAAWELVRCDPGLMLLLARQHGARAPTASFIPAALRDPALLETALHFLPQPGFVDWNRPELLPIYQTCFLQAHLAHSLAGQVAGCNADCAWMAGLLAPLGWMAAAAIAPATVAACRQNETFAAQPADTQRQFWGLDHTAIARRLSRRWGLPAWLAALIGQLGLPAGIVQTLGADATLFQVVQLAVGLIQDQGKGLGLALGATPDELIVSLGLDTERVEAGLEQALARTPNAVPIAPWQAPAHIDLLADYVRLALEQRGQADQVLLERLQQDVDQLQQALEQQCASEKERLHHQKLSALAELAAGAGHEINNPLAVISGQAQYLIAGETDPERCKALQTITGQARRIHHILVDLMHFARPSAPQKQSVSVAELLGEVTAAVEEQAGRLQVQLAGTALPAGEVRLFADPAQLRLALTCLLRNAIEAAPAEGWAGVRVEIVPGNLEFIVEDSGPGPSLLVREHLFDPFFSGRSAGRGRGLGLATAWRLAQQNGGDVYFDDRASSPTRFVLRLPVVNPEANGHSHSSPDHVSGNGCVPHPALS